MIVCILSGPDFSPEEFSRRTGIALEITRRKGETVKTGRYKGELSVETQGRLCGECETDLDKTLAVSCDDIDLLGDVGAARMWLDWIIRSPDRFVSRSLLPEQLRKLALLDADLLISCAMDGGEGGA